MSLLFGALVCLSPLLFAAIGYALGRYGLPVEVRRRKMVDRRRAPLRLVTEEDLD